jgi:hypothetical protein
MKIDTLESSKEKEKCQVEKNDDRQKAVDKMSSNKLKLRTDALK